jgi:hypothetical protein
MIFTSNHLYIFLGGKNGRFSDFELKNSFNTICGILERVHDE